MVRPDTCRCACLQTLEANRLSQIEWSSRRMFHFPPVEAITPTEFELLVKRWFESFSESLDSFEATHLEKMVGQDGEFDIDVTVRFTAFGGAKFLVICECKKHTHPIKREVIQILNDKKRSLGAHKAFLISTAPFQNGAKEYAEKHGIALMEVARGDVAYIQNSAASVLPPAPDDADRYVALFPCKAVDTHIWTVLVTSKFTYWLQEFIRFPIGTEYLVKGQHRDNVPP